MTLLLLVACGGAPYPDYWADSSRFPTIDGLAPEATASLVGGESVVISGQRLSTTRTVVIGGRNATLVEAADDRVEVLLPDGAPGGGAVDVAVVTDDGYALAEGAFTYASFGADFWQDEVASAVLYRVDCPFVAIGWYETDDEAYRLPIPWCGVEQGYADAWAFDGSGPQPGFAGDLAELAPLSTLPPPGESRLLGPADPRPPAAPIIYGVHPDDESFRVTTDRDFGRALDFVADRQAMVAEYYPYVLWGLSADDVSYGGPYAWFFDEESCYDAMVEVAAGGGETLALAQAGPASAAGLWLGFGIDDDDCGTTPDDLESGWWWLCHGATATAGVDVQGTDVVGDPEGAVLDYDGYSGFFYNSGVAGRVGASDLPAGTSFAVEHRRLGEVSTLGAVESAPELVVELEQQQGGALTTQDVMRGGVRIDGETDLGVRWAPSAAEHSAVVVELRVYDADVDDPYWMTELARIVAHGVDADGQVTIPASQLRELPLATNGLDANVDLRGYWAELTVARHQLERLPLGDEGDLVVDFMHVVNAPLWIE